MLLQDYLKAVRAPGEAVPSPVNKAPGSPLELAKSPMRTGRLRSTRMKLPPPSLRAPVATWSECRRVLRHVGPVRDVERALSVGRYTVSWWRSKGSVAYVRHSHFRAVVAWVDAWLADPEDAMGGEAGRWSRDRYAVDWLALLGWLRSGAGVGERRIARWMGCGGTVTDLLSSGSVREPAYCLGEGVLALYWRCRAGVFEPPGGGGWPEGWPPGVLLPVSWDAAGPPRGWSRGHQVRPEPYWPGDGRTRLHW